MKKNLDASKKKLAEKQKDNESLQKALKESRKEQAVLEQKVSELESRLAETDAGDDSEAPADAPSQDQASAA
jgi:BMFP domain-containing protein YqiC